MVTAAEHGSGLSTITQLATRRLRSDAAAGPATDEPRTSMFTFGWSHLAATAISAAAMPLIWFALPWLPPSARIAIMVFVLALVGWIFLKLDDTLVALVAALTLVLTNAIEPKDLYRSLGDHLIWLLVAAFMISAALRATGVVERIAYAVLRPVRSVSVLFFVITAVIILTALVIPSTSGRAALLLPVFLTLASAIENVRLVRALALLFPTVILLSAGGSLIGAGAHLIALETIGKLKSTSLDYLGWLTIGMPLAIVVSLVACLAILAMFTTRAERRMRISISKPTSQSKPRVQIYVILVLLATVAAWSTEALHGVEMALVAIAAAIAIAIKPLSSVSFKELAKGIEWGLLFFLAATLVMTNALLETGAAPRLANELMRELKPWLVGEAAITVAIVAFIAVISHLVIPSRSARAAILVPLLALPLAGLGYNPTAIALVVVMGTGFCQTLPVSAKPVAMYADLDRPTYQKPDLLWLAAVLMPVTLALLIVFALLVWPELGVPIERR